MGNNGILNEHRAHGGAYGKVPLSGRAISRASEERHGDHGVDG